MKKMAYFAAAILVLSVALSGYSIGKEEMTKEQMLVELKDDLSDMEEIFDTVPGLKSEMDAAGSPAFFFQGVNLDSLSEKDLGDLYGKVRQAAVKIRTDRIQRQLDMAKQTQRLQGAVTPPQPPRTPPSPPKAPTPPPAPQRRQ